MAKANAKKRQPQEKTVLIRDLERKRADDFISIYSNNVMVMRTPYDFQFLFGEVISDGDDGFMLNHVSVRMSPQHTKAFLNLMLDKVKEWEKQHGEIATQQESQD